MRALAVMFGSAAVLAACGERPDASASGPAEKTPAANPAPAADAPVPVVLTADLLRRICQAGLAEIHGQAPADIRIDGVEDRIVDASWRAPVDGGRRQAQCRVDGDVVTWKQVGAANPEQDRWMNEAGDPVTRFVLDGETVIINQTLPDGGGVADVREQG